MHTLVAEILKENEGLVESYVNFHNFFFFLFFQNFIRARASKISTQILWYLNNNLKIPKFSTNINTVIRNNNNNNVFTVSRSYVLRNDITKKEKEMKIKSYCIKVKINIRSVQMYVLINLTFSNKLLHMIRKILSFKQSLYQFG